MRLDFVQNISRQRNWVNHQHRNSVIVRKYVVKQTDNANKILNCFIGIQVVVSFHFSTNQRNHGWISFAVVGCKYTNTNNGWELVAIIKADKEIFTKNLLPHKCFPRKFYSGQPITNNYFKHLWFLILCQHVLLL